MEKAIHYHYIMYNSYTNITHLPPLYNLTRLNMTYTKRAIVTKRTFAKI
ncbi:hypothetical protein T190607A01A_30353 [Tenacibaculum sp. 190524A05c]|uniref:Uncharacterized protein n=1 Tax=Tenacibaculum platacis TaxID=3137852 RepID=A0ABP1ES21_9FLAO